MKTEIGERKYLDAAKIKSTNNGHLHGQPSFPPSFGKGPNIIEDKKGLRGPDPPPPFPKSGQQLKGVDFGEGERFPGQTIGRGEIETPRNRDEGEIISI